jgi:hypothetical protein
LVFAYAANVAKLASTVSILVFAVPREVSVVATLSCTVSMSDAVLVLTESALLDTVPVPEMLRFSSLNSTELFAAT